MQTKHTEQWVVLDRWHKLAEASKQAVVPHEHTATRRNDQAAIAPFACWAAISHLNPLSTIPKTREDQIQICIRGEMLGETSTQDAKRRS